MAELGKKWMIFSKSTNNRFVVGSSIINHKIRVKLNLTNDEYILADFIKQWQDKHTTRITYGDLWKATGLEPNILPIIWKGLKEKNIVYRHETGIVTTTTVWDSEFDVLSQFEDFWLIAPKGNKASARKMYERAIKVVTHETLCEKYKVYTKWCNDTDTFKKDTSSWLNPQYQYWNDDLTPKNIKKAEDKNIVVMSKPQTFTDDEL